jgi:hypothetical protein
MSTGADKLRKLFDKEIAFLAHNAVRVHGIMLNIEHNAKNFKDTFLASADNGRSQGTNGIMVWPV